MALYNTATNQWTDLPGGGMSQVRHYSASAVHKGKLYVVGSTNEDDMEATRSVDVYDDLATQHWSLLPTEMTTAREAHGVVVCEDKLYVVGGGNEEETHLDIVEVYDFATETWSLLPVPMPQARAMLNNAVVQHKGKIYVLGGYSSTENLQSVAVYDIAAEEWSVLPAEMLTLRENFAAAVHGNKIFVVGGGGYRQCGRSGHKSSVLARAAFLNFVAQWGGVRYRRC
jgi:N-acetylneuraminic acid mutarotase